MPSEARIVGRLKVQRSTPYHLNPLFSLQVWLKLVVPKHFPDGWKSSQSGWPSFLQDISLEHSTTLQSSQLRQLLDGHAQEYATSVETSST
ncbi:hypothetical protein SLA2020_430580 [Shorea laevis]